MLPLKSPPIIDFACLTGISGGRTLGPMNIGQIIRRQRQARGLTQQQVADHLGLSQSTVLDLEQDKRHLRLTEAVPLADLLGLDPTAFLPGARALSADERELLDIYRALDPVDQDALLRIARSLRIAQAAAEDAA